MMVLSHFLQSLASCIARYAIHLHYDTFFRVTGWRFFLSIGRILFARNLEINNERDGTIVKQDKKRAFGVREGGGTWVLNLNILCYSLRKETVSQKFKWKSYNGC